MTRANRQARWAARLEKFVSAQRWKRDWINFGDIAEWFSREDHKVQPDEEKRSATFDLLATDVLRREFEELGRSQLRYLHPAVPPRRLTRADLADAISGAYDGAKGKATYLPYCWITRAAFDAFLARHNLGTTPDRFLPTPDPNAVRDAKTPRGRPDIYKWPAVEEMLRDHVQRIGPIKSVDELRQLVGDFAEDLSDNDERPSERTIKRAIEKYRFDSNFRRK